MQRRVAPANFDDWFNSCEELMRTGPSGYVAEVKRIRQLTERGSAEDVVQLAHYLRPWSIKSEGNWIARELLRSVATQCLRYLAVRSPQSRAILEGILQEEPRWNDYSDEFRQEWRDDRDASSLEDPYEDFLRYVRAALQRA